MVNPQSRQLFRDDAEVHLSTKAFHLLCTLLTRRPDVASKAELLRVVWPDSFVIEANLNVLIGEIRRSLGDDPQQPQYIRTVHGVGYAFCAEATEESHPRSSDGRGKHSLLDRMEGSDVSLDRRGQRGWTTPGVQDLAQRDWCVSSTRAHLRRRPDGPRDARGFEQYRTVPAVDQQPVTAPRALSDGDVLQIGSAELTFREWSADASRETERIRKPHTQ